MTSEAQSTDDSWVEAIIQRHKAFPQRVAMTGVAAIAISPIVGWSFLSVWLCAYVAIQALDLWALEPITKGKAQRLPLPRHILACTMMFANAAAYGALGVPLWIEGGMAGGLCAIFLWTGGAIYSVVNSPGSRQALLLTLTPMVIYLAATPFLLTMLGTSSQIVSAAIIAVAVHAFHYLGTWNKLDKSRLAETEARREADRQRNEALQTVEGRTAFLSAVGHDLRTPLTAILTGADAVGKAGAEANNRSNAQLITDAGEMMKALLDDLLDHAKLDAGHMQVDSSEFDLRQLVTQTLRLWRAPVRGKGLRLRVEGSANLPRGVVGDPIRLRQILNNLISNALKFTNEGTITLRLSAWSLETNDHAILMQVVDTGPGMNTAQMARLFTPFDQTVEGVSARHGGTGLGLAISRQLVELMGGRLTARSKPGQGAAFIVSLVMPAVEILTDAPPVPDATGRAAVAVALMQARDAAPSSLVHALPEPEPVTLSPPVSPDTEPLQADDDDSAERPLRVLVVDDHDINRRAISLILQPLGCEVTTAADGLSALKQCDAQTYDLIFMDVRMPELDGRETTRRLRAGVSANAGTPVIAVTADTAPEDITACMTAGMDYFVPKPITPATLLGAINHVLAAANQDEQAQAEAVA